MPRPLPPPQPLPPWPSSAPPLRPSAVQRPLAPALRLQGVGHRYGGAAWVLKGFELEVPAGAFLTLLGPSGCGKSTVLRLLAGLEQAELGEVNTPREGLACVFQEATLMPWASVGDNIQLPLRLQGCPRPQAEAAARDALERVGLAACWAHFPDALSGGMKMRVSLARALATRPQVLLLDEPFAALDEITRQQLGRDLLRCWNELGFTTVFVTHNLFEAALLSERVVVMSGAPSHRQAVFDLPAHAQRNAAYRGSEAFARSCMSLEQALEQAHA
jgi:NitT/TauT family transport system ATP-binding protein